ncbi:hypothetical protein NP233_g9898 [Leucocoprinus birnbaumii]|uniref:Uncharacterized protein n=1 Tax=Leucocoprinus birnbaumii TaxID=56174 RepID=A0AAD5VQ51_9AGAR|nr:hypothetical protein NP233_g9898 [Leucocoprinus birnbaumii]
MGRKCGAESRLSVEEANAKVDQLNDENDKSGDLDEKVVRAKKINKRTERLGRCCLSFKQGKEGIEEERGCETRSRDERDVKGGKSI